MSNVLSKLYALEAGDSLSPDECAQVNSALAEISAMDVPPSQIANVRSYLNSQFLYQQVDPAHIARLERLESELSALD